MQAHCQSTKFPGLGRSCDFSKLPLEEGLEEKATVQGFALSEGGTSLAGRCFQNRNRLTASAESRP
jgi:hypothetical protein